MKSNKMNYAIPLIVSLAAVLLVAGVWFFVLRDTDAAIIPREGADTDTGADYNNGEQLSEPSYDDDETSDTDNDGYQGYAYDSPPSDLTLTWVAPPQFDEIGHPSDGMMAVRVGDQWGFINMQGEEIVPPRYTNVISFFEGIAMVNINAQPNEWGNPVGGQWGFIDTQGNEVVPPAYNIMTQPRNGLSFFMEGGTQDEWGGWYGGVWGAVDAAGNIVIEPIYGTLNYFEHGLIAFRYSNYGLWGFMDTSGNILAQPQFTETRPIGWLESGMAAVRLGGEIHGWEVIGGAWGVIGPDGEMAIEAIYDNIIAICDDWFAVQIDGTLTDYGMMTGGLWGFVDATGQELVAPMFSSATGGLFDNIAMVSIDNYWGAADRYGNMIIPAIYAGLGHIAHGLVAVRTGEVSQYGGIVGGNMGIIEIATGHILIPPQYYDEIHILGENLLAMRVGSSIGDWGGFVGGTWGLMDISGNHIVEPRFDQISYEPDDSLIRVHEGGTLTEWGGFEGGGWGFIDHAGQVVIPTEYDALWTSTSGLVSFMLDGSFVGGGIVGGRWGIMDMSGNVILPPNFDMASVLSRDILVVMVDSSIGEWGERVGGRWGLYDGMGRVIATPRYDTIGFLYEGLISVLYNGMWGIARVD